MKEYFLKTDRIGFSHWTADDLELATELWGQPDVSRFICAKGVFSLEEIKNRLQLEVGNYEKYGVQYFPFFELSSANLIGCCGLRPYKNEKDIFEIGFHLKKEYWRQGVGFEAATAMIDYSFHVLNAKELKAGHNPNNIGSKMLLQKLGFQYEEDCFYEPTGLYHPSYSLQNVNSKELTKELTELLREKGAALVGVGDMTQVENCSFSRGVSVALPVPQNIIQDLLEGPTKEYYDMYYAWNKKLNEIVLSGEAFLKERGYDAIAQTTDVVKINTERVSAIPHKTVATRAGLGWIGKNCLLVTEEYGPAIRISSLLTNAPLIANEPINQSKCGACTLCVKACPAHALKGTLWEVGMKREEIVDREQCFQKQIEIMKERTGIEQDLCGKCFAVCRFTKKGD